ncbi:MAG: glycosidase [Bacillota bacterium]|nr:glycosidase [Bacillota bacterium]
MAFRLRRLSERPILEPDPAHRWEAAAVFNPGAVVRKGRVVLLYRGSDRPFRAEGEPYVSAIGYAESTDGLHFARRPRPVMVGDGGQARRGVQDPRVVPMDDRYYMVYTAFGGRGPGDYRIALAASRDLVHWGGRRVLLEEPNKDGALLPDRPDGRYYLFHRRPPDIWLAVSGDLHRWEDHRVILRPRPGSWESSRIGIGPQPLRTDQGWLLIYHGVDERNTYRLGAALLDPRDPFRVLDRLPDPILEPELDWEREGLVPDVVFSCGAVDLGDRFLVYYGAADTRIGVAELRKSEARF